MGSCVSVHKWKPSGLVGSETDRTFVVAESPVKGSKEDDTFFDSQAWLDSEYEDDFFSVNGDSTPSCGNTPLHHRFSTRIPQVNKTPTEKKRLSQLFQASPRGELNVNEEVQTPSAQTTPFILGTNSANGSKRIPNGNALSGKETSMQRCLPSLVSCRSLSGRKKRKSPAVHVSGKAWK